MIHVQDNFLPINIFSSLQKYCEDNPFEIVTVGEKKFSVLPTPDEVDPIIQIPGHKIILSFIRNAHKDFDTLPRIHADNIINGKKTSLARVIYLNDPHGVTPNGTSFYKHEKYGPELPDNISFQVFNDVLIKDSNNLSKWTPTDFIYSYPNRSVLYNSNYFHSKFPYKIEKGTRIVLVVFYTKLYT